MNKEIKGETFTKEIIEPGGLAIVQFKTEWNGWCQIMEPVYRELSKAYSKKARFFTIDTEHEKSLAKLYRIVELPTILIFKNGELIDNVSGLTPKSVLITILEDAIAGIND